MAEPIRFELSGDDGVVVTYAAGAGRSGPALTFRNEQLDLSFTGDDVALTTAPVGTLATVELLVVPDHKRSTFTLVVPEVRLGDDEEVDVTTVGLRTDERSSIAPGQLRGQLRRTWAIELAGHARRSPS